MIKLVINEKNTYLENLNNMPTSTHEDIALGRNEIVTNFRENWQQLTKAEKLQFILNYIAKITAVTSKDEKSRITVKVLKVDFFDN